MSERDEQLASEMIAARLRDPAYQDRLAVNRSKDTGYSDQVDEDLLNMNDVELRAEYGDDVWRESWRVGQGAARLRRSDAAERSTGNVITDSAAGAGSAAYRTFGNLAGIGAGFMVEGLTDGAIPREQATADILNEHNANVEAFLQENLSDELQNRQRFFGIEGQLDALDNQFEFEQEVEAGANPTIAAMRREGKNALDAGERAWENPSVTGQIISEGIGDLAISAPLGGVTGLAAKGASQALIRNTINNRVTRAMGAATVAGGYAAGATVQEVAGVYAESVQDVMSIPVERLAETSTVFQGLIAEGMTPQEAQSQLAGLTAETAALRQVAPSIALGFITSKFEAMPLGVFRESGIAGGLLQIAGEGIEEAGQGISGTINRNMSVEKFAEIGRSALEGTGEEAALGAIAGMGVAGVAATPAATIGGTRRALDAPRQAADALLRETSPGGTSRAFQAGETLASGFETARNRTTETAQAINESPAGQAVRSGANAAVSRTTDAVNTINTRDDRAQTKGNVVQAVEAARIVEDEVARDNLSLEVTKSVTRTGFKPSEGLADVANENQTVMQNVTGIMTKLADKTFKPSVEDKAFIAEQVKNLKNIGASLPIGARRRVGKLLQSSQVQDAVNDVKEFDLNKTDPAPGQEVPTTINVAKTNPTNVDPVKTNKMLEESGDTISEEDKKYLTVASKVASAINNAVGNLVRIRQEQNIGLEATGRVKEKPLTVEDTSRNIMAKGYTNSKGENLRSLNDFASDIIQGVQSPDGTFINQKGEVVPVKNIAMQFGRFIEHMNNRVQALNTSFDNNRPNSKGMMTGSNEKFRMLRNGEKWVDPTDPAWNGNTLTYHISNPNSVAFAQQVESDTQTAYEIYQAMAEAFPEVFSDIAVPSLVQLKRVEDAGQETNPAVVEEEAPASDEQENNTETNEQTPTAVEEEVTPVASDEQTKDTNPTVSEEEMNSEEGADETGAPATDETVSDEEISSDERIDLESLTDEVEFDDAELTVDNFVRKVRQFLVKENLNQRRNNARKYMERVMGTAAKAVRDIQVYSKDSKYGPGYIFYDKNRRIYLREDLFNENYELTPFGRAVVVHETGHAVDYQGDSDVGTWYSKGVTFYENGRIFNEFKALKGYSNFLDDRIAYVEDHEGHDMAKEMFAVLTELQFSTYQDVFDNSPAITELMEIIYGQREATRTGPETSQKLDGEQDSDPITSDNEEETTSTRVTHKAFGETYLVDPNSTAPASLAALEKEVSNNGGLNPKIIEFSKEMAPVLLARINERLRGFKEKIDGKTATAIEHLKDGKIQELVRYRATVIADPETGLYDQNLVELATVAMVDWLANASPQDPSRMKDNLEKQGLSMVDITDDQLRDMAFGIAPSVLKPQLANAILKMWGVKKDKSASMGRIYGIAEGLASELLVAMNDQFDFFSIKPIELTQVDETTNPDTGDKELVNRKTTTILLNMEKIREMQTSIRENAQVGVENTARDYLFNEAREKYSIGTKIKGTPQTQDGSSVRLSRREKAAIKAMQDTPHYVDKERGSIFHQIGGAGLYRLFGYVENVNEETYPNGTLRRSIMGKNISIENNLADAEVLTNSISDATVPVYYPVGITRVGRHQYQGVNPQSNKIVRALVTPTWTDVDIATQEDAVWLGVAQAADLHKLEKGNHEQIISTIRDDFELEYGRAKDMILEFLRTGNDMDSDAFVTAVLGNTKDFVEPQILAAIHTVAKMQLAKERGEASFRSSMSVELDGLTNGAANMMVNYGQGEVTPDEMTNLQRVGYFIGQAGKTVNDFFGTPGNVDMYETVSRRAQDKMNQALRGEMGRETAAARRFAGWFGDFKMNSDTGQFEMTRNSAKNPMTKVNYGSGVLGVGTGLADDMMIEFYAQLHKAGYDLDKVPYDGDIVADLKTLGVFIPTEGRNNTWEFSKNDQKAFRQNITQTIGKALTEAAQETLGSKIKELNDMLVFSTNVQAEYLNRLFLKRIDERAVELMNEGVIRKNPKTGQPIIMDMPVAEYDKIVDELSLLSPIFTSADQTLSLGGFEPRIARNWSVLSSALDNTLNQKPMLRQPEDVGVKALPFMVIGTGDAMMMNLIFSDPNVPQDILGIFDGLDIPVTKLKEYGPMANKAVLQSWERDVLSMAVENFRGFLNNETIDQDVLDGAFAVVKDKNKKSTVTALSNAQLMTQLDQRLAANRARKAVFKKIPVSVDQMGGSDVGFSREGENIGLTAINQMIAREEGNRPVETVEQLAPEPEAVKTPVVETTVDAVIKGTRFTEAQKKVLEIIKPALQDVRVIYGTIDQMNAWRLENLPDDGNVLNAPAQYDPHNDIIFLSTAKPETLLHELVHATTFQKVLQHYNGQKNEAVTRLETLMEEFLVIEDGGDKVREAQKAILLHRATNDPFHKAAAVNELMAYVLANNKVRTKAQSTKSNMLASLQSKVIRFMRRLLGGAPETIFDGVVFNTKVLIDGPIEDRKDTGGNGNGGDKNSTGDLTPPANNYTNYWIQQVAQYIDESPELTDAMGNNLNVRRDEQTKVRASVDRIVDSFRQVGMLSNDEARLTFKAIYGVINSSITLKSQPLIAMTNVFNHIVENMTPEMFGNTSEANQEYSAVLNAFGDIGNADMINSISVLLGLSQTSAKFRAVLDQIPEPETGNTSTSLQQNLTVMAASLMNNITGTLSEAGNVKDVMDMLAATIVEHDKDREWLALRKVTSSLDTADKYVSGKMQSVAEIMRKTDRETKASTRSKTRKHLTSLVTLGTNYLDKPGTDLSNTAVKNVFHMGLPFLSLVPVRELVSEMVGTDIFNRNVVSLQDKVNAAISGMRQAYREDLPGILANLFDQKPTKEQWKDMFNVLAKTDFSVLVDSANIDAAMRLLSDKTARTQRIRALESQVDAKLVPYVAQDAKDKGEQLARHMTKQGTGKLLMKNAYAIAKNLDGDIDLSLVPILDELISMYALDMMNPNQRDSVANMYQSDPEALEQIVVYMKGLNDAEEAKPNITEIAKLNAIKGYIPNEGRENTRIVIAPTEDKNKMKLRGFTQLGEYSGDPDSVFERSYYVTTIRTSGQYAQGTMQNVSSTYRGVDTNTGLSISGDFTGYVSGDGSVDRAVETLNSASYDLENEFETWVPVLDSDGTVSGFERSIDPNVIEAHMDRDENLAIMLGAWAGRHVEEATAYQYNIQLVDELDEIWQNRESNEENLFVNLKKTDDPIYKESFSLIPQNVKAYMDTKFDGEGMMVRKDMANLSVGYREASLADFWTGKTRMPKDVQKVVQGVTQMFMGRNAMKWLVQSETALQGAVSTAKDWIVIRSLIVPALNMQANVTQLASRGVPLKTMQKDFRRKLAEVEKHQQNVTKIIELRELVRLRANNQNQRKILEDKIKALEDLNSRMSIAPMIEAGAYKNLSEGITEFDKDIASGHIGDYLEKTVERLPGRIRTIGEYGLVSKSTKLYQVANRATQYGDFLAKSIYYDHLLTKGLSPDAAVEQINQEYVNYTTQPGRVRSALERNGMTWFLAFKLRIAKIAMQQMRDNPVRSFAVNYAFDVGSPIEDNIFSVIMDGNLDYATGLEMMFNAPELNPWYNLISN